MIRVLQTILLGFVILSSASVAAESGETFESRVKELEKQNTELDERHKLLEEKIDKLQNETTLAQEQTLELDNQLHSFMNISGYADVEFRASSKSNENPGFRLHHFSLIFTKNISKKWRFFSEIEYEDAPEFSAEGETQGDFAIFKSFNGKIFLEAMNIDYLMMREANFRVGRFFTPAGIWLIDHYPPFVPTQVLPTHIGKIFPQLVDGGLIYGSIQMGETFLKYDTYTGNGEGNSGSGDKNSEKAFGVKLSLHLPILKYFELGASYYQDTLNNSEDKTAVGAHAKLNFWSMMWQSEYAQGSYKGIDNIGKEEVNFDKVGYYSQLMYSIDKFAVGYRYDFYDSDTEETNNVGELTTNSLFVNYHVAKNIVTKIEYHKVDTYRDSNEFEYDEAIASIVVYLGD